jgi:hypothetical protein
MRRPPRPGETIWVNAVTARGRRVYERRVLPKVVTHHAGLWIGFYTTRQAISHGATFRGLTASSRRTLREEHRVRRFEEGTSWWRDGVDSYAARVVEALTH